VLLLVKRRFRSFKWLLTALALASLCMFLADPSEYQRFYFFQYRFFELASGGLLAVSITPRRSGLRGGLVWLVALLALLSANLSISSPLRLVLVLATTLCLLASDGARHRWHVAALTTPVCVFIGLTSFSLYMWHQVLLAFTRYCLVPDITIGVAGCVIATCVLLSYVTWRYIERPFRNPRTISTATVLVFVCLMTAVSSAFAAVIYLRAGVLRDVPELDVRTDNIRRGMHSAYNHRVHASDAPFQETDKVKILVIGNSFARDWANVLLESHCRDSIVVSYAPRIDQEAIDRASKASLVYVHTGPEGMAALPLPMDRVWFIGTKSFGTSNGIAYNARGSDSYCSMRVRPERRVVDENEEMRLVAGDRYVDLLSRVTDSAGEVPVFTPTCKFISQDTRHLTRAGAEYFAGLMAPEINEHLSRAARGTR